MLTFILATALCYAKFIIGGEGIGEGGTVCVDGTVGIVGGTVGIVGGTVGLVEHEKQISLQKYFGLLNPQYLIVNGIVTVPAGISRLLRIT